MRQISYTSPVFTFGCLILTIFCTDFITTVSGTKCEPMKVEKCRGMPWTLTHMPNLVHHSSQKNADLVLSQFDPLLQLPGSHSLLFFLCSMFTPMCFQHGDEYPRVVPPCRSICEEARNRVEPIMRKHNVSWPEALNCDDLPEYHRGMCIEPNAFIQRPEVQRCSLANPVKCGKCRRFKINEKRFVEQDYDFVIRAQVDKITQKPCDAEARVNISEVYKMKKLFITPGVQTLTFNTSCICPKLRRRRVYILAGHQNPKTGKLLLHPQSMAEKAGRKKEKKVARWLKKRSPKTVLNRRRRTHGAGPPKRRGKKRRQTQGSK